MDAVGVSTSKAYDNLKHAIAAMIRCFQRNVLWDAVHGQRNFEIRIKGGSCYI